MAHTFDTNVNPNFGNSSPFAFNYTCGANATVLVLSIGVDLTTARQAAAPTYNGVAFLQGDQVRVGGETNVEQWYYISPPTGQSLQISIPNNTFKSLCVVASSYNAGSTPSVHRASSGATGTSTNPTGPTHTGLAAGDVIVAICGSGANTFAPSAQTGVSLRVYDYDFNGWGIQYYIVPDNNDVAMSWTFGTNEDWAIVSTVIRETVVDARRRVVIC